MKRVLYLPFLVQLLTSLLSSLLSFAFSSSRESASSTYLAFLCTLRVCLLACLLSCLLGLPSLPRPCVIQRCRFCSWSSSSSPSPRLGWDPTSLPAVLAVEHVHGVLVLVGPPVPEQVLVRIHLVRKRTPLLLLLLF